MAQLANSTRGLQMNQASLPDPSFFVASNFTSQPTPHENINNFNSSQSYHAKAFIARFNEGEYTSKQNIIVSESFCNTIFENKEEGFILSTGDFQIRKGMIDSGCNEHLSGDLCAMENVQEIVNPGYVKSFRNTFVAAPTHIGDIRMITLNIDNKISVVVLKDVRYDKECTLTLISEDKFTASGCFLESWKDYSNITLDGESILYARRENREKWTYFVTEIEFRKVTLETFLYSSLRFPDHQNAYPAHFSRSKDEQMTVLWHHHLAHASAHYIRKAMDAVDDMPRFRVVSEVIYDCTVCSLAKSSRTPHTAVRTRSIRVLERIHTDIMGKLEKARTGECYTVSFIDDYSGYSTTYAIFKKI